MASPFSIFPKEVETIKKEELLEMILGIAGILLVGLLILLIPYGLAKKRDVKESVIIEEYLEQEDGQEADHRDSPSSAPEGAASPATEQTSVSSQAQAADYLGEIDSILVIDKINLSKAIIRGEHNDYNLDRYFFVTADQTSQLGIDNYIIYGHCSQTYGHSFNRLEELEAGDTFYLIRKNVIYTYTVRDSIHVLHAEAANYLSEETGTVQLFSCEKEVAPGFSEKRLIIVTAERDATR